ncbi:MAG: hypothetical protein QOI92_2557 [Chloroflexota bacterium]|nr:hypothetical protein [Chloroflexota bacterium]
MDTRLAPNPPPAAAVVWLDRTHALVARAREGHSVITEVDRDMDPEIPYLLRVLHEARAAIASSSWARIHPGSPSSVSTSRSIAGPIASSTWVHRIRRLAPTWSTSCACSSRFWSEGSWRRSLSSAHAHRHRG